MINNKRNIGVDLLKIILALMVITIHFNARATGNVYNSVNFFPLKFLVYGIHALCLPAVNCYILITGYFSYSNNKPYPKVLVGLWSSWKCLIFFSILGLSLELFLGGGASFNQLISRAFPILSGEWWFMSVYFLLVIISPVINNFIQGISSRQGIWTLIISLLFCSIAPLFFKGLEPYGLNMGSGLIWFVIMYMTGCILKKESENITFSRLSTLRRMIIYIIISIVALALNYFTSKSAVFKSMPISAYNSIIIYIQSIILFLAFKDIHIKSIGLNKVIITLSSLSIASYVFHCQPEIGSFIWNTFVPSQYANSFVIIPIYIILVFSIYLISIWIEFIRRKYIDDIVSKRLNIEKHIQSFINGIVKL